MKIKQTRVTINVKDPEKRRKYQEYKERTKANFSDIFCQRMDVLIERDKKKKND